MNMTSVEIEIGAILDSFRRKEDSSYYEEKDSYYEFLEEEEYGKKYNLEEEMEKVFEKFGITQYNFCQVGEFKSPEYNLYCNCMAYIDLDGKLKTIPVNFEIY